MFSPPVDVGLFSISGQIEREMARRYGALALDTRRVVEGLEAKQNLFRPGDYEWIRDFLHRLETAVGAFRSVHTAFIRHRVIEEKGSTPEGESALREDLAEIRRLADELEREIQPPMELVNADRMRAFADGLEKLHSSDPSE
jgi:hypothetical protein